MAHFHDAGKKVVESISFDGDGNTRQSISIVVNNIQLLGHSKSADETSCNKTAENHMAQMREMLQEESEDIPF